LGIKKAEMPWVMRKEKPRLLDGAFKSFSAPCALQVFERDITRWAVGVEASALCIRVKIAFRTSTIFVQTNSTGWVVVMQDHFGFHHRPPIIRRSSISKVTNFCGAVNK